MKEWLTTRNALGAVTLCLFFRTAGAIKTNGVVSTEMAILSLVLLVLTACIFSRQLSEYFAGPFTRFIDMIYYGNDDRERVRPPVNLQRADFHRTRGSFDKAIAEYKRQLKHHPRSPDLWGGLINTALEAGNPDLAKEFRRRAFRRLKGGDRIVLERGISRR
jgi:hypothetical protein